MKLKPRPFRVIMSLKEKKVTCQVEVKCFESFLGELCAGYLSGLHTVLYTDQ